MFLSISDKLQQMDMVPMVIISIALILFLGFAMTRITKLLKLPNVTAYIIVGVLLGPFCFKVIPQTIISNTDFISDIALAFIAFGTGEFFKIKELKANGGKVILIALFETFFSMIFVFIMSFVILRLPLAFSIVIAAIAASTTPTSTMMTIRQTGAKGDFVNTLLQVIAVDSIIALLSYSIAISIAVGDQGNSGFNVMNILKPTLINIGVMVLGGLFGFLLKLLMPKKRTTDNRLIISLATLFLFCGICVLLGVSPLLGCMAMGTVYRNISDREDKLFQQMSYFSPPFLLIFFVRSGLNFNLGSLLSMDSGINGISLILIVVLYLVFRILGKYLGGLIGCIITKKPKTTRNFLGLALFPQTSVAIGLTALAVRELSSPLGTNLQLVIIATSIIFEIIGPVCAKLSLYYSKSYSNNIEDLTTVEMLNVDGSKKTEVEILISRIKDIQTKLPEPNVPSEEEQAFTEAAIEQYNSFVHYRNKKWRK